MTQCQSSAHFNLSDMSNELLEERFKKKLERNQQKLILNLGNAYNKITLERMHKEKKEFLMEAKKSFSLLHQSDLVQEMQREQQFNPDNLDCKQFVNYLNKTMAMGTHLSQGGQKSAQNHKRNVVNLQSAQQRLGKATQSAQNINAFPASRQSATDVSVADQKILSHDNTKSDLNQSDNQVNKDFQTRDQMEKDLRMIDKNSRIENPNKKLQCSQSNKRSNIQSNNTLVGKPVVQLNNINQSHTIVQVDRIMSKSSLTDTTFVIKGDNQSPQVSIGSKVTNGQIIKQPEGQTGVSHKKTQHDRPQVNQFGSKMAEKGRKMFKNDVKQYNSRNNKYDSRTQINSSAVNRRKYVSIGNNYNSLANTSNATMPSGLFKVSFLEKRSQEIRVSKMNSANISRINGKTCRSMRQDPPVDQDPKNMNIIENYDSRMIEGSVIINSDDLTEISGIKYAGRHSQKPPVQSNYDVHLSRTQPIQFSSSQNLIQRIHRTRLSRNQSPNNQQKSVNKTSQHEVMNASKIPDQIQLKPSTTHQQLQPERTTQNIHVNVGQYLQQNISQVEQTSPKAGTNNQQQPSSQQFSARIPADKGIWSNSPPELDYSNIENKVDEDDAEQTYLVLEQLKKLHGNCTTKVEQQQQVKQICRRKNLIRGQSADQTRLGNSHDSDKAKSNIIYVENLDISGQEGAIVQASDQQSNGKNLVRIFDPISDPTDNSVKTKETLMDIKNQKVVRANYKMQVKDEQITSIRDDKQKRVQFSGQSGGSNPKGLGNDKNPIKQQWLNPNCNSKLGEVKEKKVWKVSATKRSESENEKKSKIVGNRLPRKILELKSSTSVKRGKRIEMHGSKHSKHSSKVPNNSDQYVITTEDQSPTMNKPITNKFKAATQAFDSYSDEVLETDQNNKENGGGRFLTLQKAQGGRSKNYNDIQNDEQSKATKNYNHDMIVIERMLDNIQSQNCMTSNETFEYELYRNQCKLFPNDVELYNWIYNQMLTNSRGQSSRNIKGLKSSFNSNFIDQMCKEIKITNQACQRVVAGSDEQPRIDHEQETYIELEPDVHLCYKCEVFGLASPLMFNIKVRSLKNKKQTNLEIFLSTRSKDPNPDDYEMKFQQVDKFFVHANKIGKLSMVNLTLHEQNELEKNREQKNKLIPKKSEAQEKFQDNFIYLGIRAHQNCSIRMIYKQQKSRKIIARERLDRLRDEREQFHMQVMENFLENDPYYEAMIDMDLREREEKERFRQIIDGEPYRFLLKAGEEQRKMYYQLRDLKQYLSKQKRKQQEENIREKNNLMLSKREHMKELKLQMIHERIKVVRACQRAKSFITLFTIYQFLQTLVMKYKYNIQKTIKKNKGAFLSLIVRQRHRRMVKCRGPTIEDRSQIIMRNIFTVLVPSMMKGKEERSKEVVKSLIVEWGGKMELRLRVRKSAQAVQTITQRAYNNLNSQKAKRHALLYAIWEEQLLRVCEVLNAPDSKQSERMMWKDCVAKTSFSNRVFIVDTYIERQKIQDRIQFMMWYQRRVERKNQDGEEGNKNFIEKQRIKSALFQNKLIYYKTLVENIDRFLDAGLERIRFEVKAKKKVKIKTQKLEAQKQEVPQERNSTYLTELQDAHEDDHQQNSVNIKRLSQNAKSKNIQKQNEDQKSQKSNAKKSKARRQTIVIKEAIKTSKKCEGSENATIENVKSPKEDEISVTCQLNSLGNNIDPLPRFRLIQTERPHIVRRLIVKASLIKQKDIINFTRSMMELKTSQNQQVSE